jgi:hypothetical protein
MKLSQGNKGRGRITDFKIGIGNESTRTGRVQYSDRNGDFQVMKTGHVGPPY